MQLKILKPQKPPLCTLQFLSSLILAGPQMPAHLVKGPTLSFKLGNPIFCS